VIDETLFEAEEKMEKAVTVARDDFAGIRTGRAQPAMFNKVQADYYGTPTPVTQMSSLHVVDARMVIITPYDKGLLGAIEKAIRDSDLGVNPTDDGSVIRVSFPQLTEERRREFIKVAKTKAEDGRIAIRNVRRHAMGALEKLADDGKAGEDEVRRAAKHLEDVTHRYIASVDDMLKHKEAELLEV
jgi:ribosome recycling factor